MRMLLNFYEEYGDFGGNALLRQLILYLINKLNYHIFENRVFWIGKMKVVNTVRFMVNYQNHYPEKG